MNFKVILVLHQFPSCCPLRGWREAPVMRASIDRYKCRAISFIFFIFILLAESNNFPAKERHSDFWVNLLVQLTAFLQKM